MLSLFLRHNWLCISHNLKITSNLDFFLNSFYSMWNFEVNVSYGLIKNFRIQVITSSVSLFLLLLILHRKIQYFLEKLWFFWKKHYEAMKSEKVEWYWAEGNFLVTSEVLGFSSFPFKLCSSYSWAQTLLKVSFSFWEESVTSLIIIF